MIYVFVCPECGHGVKADEDGCCAYCGRDCIVEKLPVTPENYLEGALRTEPRTGNFNKGLGLLQREIRLLHASMGMVTEAGELMDQLKKHLFYGKELDDVNLIEEAGDILWYMAILLDELGVTFEKVMLINHEKLAKRYGREFTEEAALHRDLTAEREILEKINK